MARTKSSNVPESVLKALANHVEAARAHIRDVCERTDASDVKALCERLVDGKGDMSDADKLYRLCIQSGISVDVTTAVFDSATMVAFAAS